MISTIEYVSSYSIAVAYVGLGEKNAAVGRLLKAYEDRDDQIGILGIEPFFESLHSDSRFQELLRLIGLSKPNTSSPLAASFKVSL